ncbi:hypothetical protein C5167_050843 [Papaver somniferum]|uniref:Uncharacterized protein n=1 Tax=Papaver somniferum TaxID=3469 RepID=A0A4Y7KRB5_PAPSO|nr:hypothetical protein C5167_050843 [Papaver somniferum]
MEEEEKTINSKEARQFIVFADMNFGNTSSVTISNFPALHRINLTSVGLRSLNLGLCPKLEALDIDALKVASSVDPSSCIFSSCLFFPKQIIPPYNVKQQRVLKVHVCKYLEDLKEGVLPSLRELDLSYGSICQSAIEELLSCCTHLTHSIISHCLGRINDLPNSLTIYYRILTALCCRISEEAVEVAVSHCNMLQTFDIRFCPKIHSVRTTKFRPHTPPILTCQISFMVSVKSHFIDLHLRPP